TLRSDYAVRPNNPHIGQHSPTATSALTRHSNLTPRSERRPERSPKAGVAGSNPAGGTSCPQSSHGADGSEGPGPEGVDEQPVVVAGALRVGRGELLQPLDELLVGSFEGGQDVLLHLDVDDAGVRIGVGHA